MALTDLFRSKHRHSDPEVRAQAIREIEDATLLAAIAREDEEAAVRKLAIDRLADADALAAIAEADGDAAVREHARKRASQLWLARAAGGDPAVGRRAVEAVAKLGDQRALIELVKRSGPDAVRREALDRINDARALADVARSNAPADLRAAAIERIDDGELLRAIAIDDTHKDVAMAALVRIADAAALEAVAHKAKVKAVRARARKVLDGAAAERDGGGDGRAGGSADDEARRLRAERIQLCQNIESLAMRHEWVDALEQIEAAEAVWRGLGPCEDERLQRRFEQAGRTYRNRRAKFARQSAVKPAPQAQLDGDAEEIRPEDVPTVVQIDLIDVPKIDVDVDHDHDHDHEPDEAKKQAKAELREQNLIALEKLVRELEDIEGLKKIKSAERKLQAAQEAHDALGPLPSGPRRAELQERYAKGRQALVIKLQELREADEWQRWANVPLREELVKKAEALLAAEDDKKLAEHLHELQVQWKNLGPVPHKKGQELWEKFKATCDLVYARVKVDRAHAAEERGENLDRKRELAERAEALKESTDWDATAEEIKRLQAAWKAIGPVPRKQGEEMWQRFRGACDHFFARRKPHLDERLGELSANLADKEAMIARAEALAESADWDAAANELKRLQREWRDIGPVPRRESQPLYDRFRAACDKFFARLDDSRNSERRAREQALAELAAGLEATAEAARSAAPAEEVVPRVLELRTKVLGLDDGSPQQRAQLRTAMAALLRDAVTAYPDAFKGTEVDPVQSRKRKEKLLAKAEELIPPPPAPKGPLTAEQIAAQLKAALSDRALGGVLSKHSGRPPTELIAELRESWARLGPVPGAEGESLEQRFESACAKALAPRS